MTLDLEIKETELESRTKDYDSIRLSSKIKHNGVFDQSACARFNHEWFAKVSNLPEVVAGMYIKSKQAVNYAIENVNCHGGDTIDISLKYSDSEILVTIADNGNGFDVKGTLEKFFASQRHYKLSGFGIQGMHESPARVWFNETGNKTFVMYERSRENDS